MDIYECLKLITERIKSHQSAIARKQRAGLQASPWIHRVRELEVVKKEIAKLGRVDAAPLSGNGNGNGAGRAAK